MIMAKTMNVGQMIKELEKMGFKVNARKRTDGGWIITKINDMTFTGASGNQYARDVLGVEMSQARIEQVHFNVNKYIKVGKGKREKALDPEMQKELQKVQRIWRKTKIHGKITAKKVKYHIQEMGREEAEAYLKKQKRYGQGLAYLENVKYMADYMRDWARSVKDKDIQEGYLKMADRLEEKAEMIKQDQLNQIHDVLYEVKETGWEENACAQGLTKIVFIIG